MGAIAIPIFRFILTRVFRMKEIDDELEKDLEQWFRGSMLLLAATANMEHLVFFWTGLGDAATAATGVAASTGGHNWLSVCLRLLLAIGVVEAMPDQELFAVIHPGPPPIRPHRGVFREVWRKKKLIAKGIVCQHLNRLSPVMAIMCAIFGGRYETDPTAWTVGWACYGMAIFQYLIIGLVTSRDKALDVLTEFDRAVAKRRRDLIREFDIKEPEPKPLPKKERWWQRRSWKRWRKRDESKSATEPTEDSADQPASATTATPIALAGAIVAGSQLTDASASENTAKSSDGKPSETAVNVEPEKDSDKSVVADATKPDN